MFILIEENIFSLRIHSIHDWVYNYPNYLILIKYLIDYWFFIEINLLNNSNYINKYKKLYYKIINTDDIYYYNLKYDIITFNKIYPKFLADITSIINEVVFNDFISIRYVWIKVVVLSGLN